MVIDEKYIGLVSAVVGAALWSLALQLPEIPTHGDVGPAFFPKIIAVLLFVCAAFFLLQGLRNRQTRPAGGPWDLETIFKILSLLAVTIIYVALMEPLGFVATTFAYLIAGGYIFGNRRWLLLCASSTVCSVLLYAVFKAWLKVPLPAWDNFMSALAG